METNDKPTNMVARNESTRNTFRVQKNEPESNQTEQQVTELSAEEAELAAVEDGLNQRKNELAAKRLKLDEDVRAEKIEKRSSLLNDAADYREMARGATDPVRAKEYIRLAKDAEASAAQLGVELNLNEPAPVVAEEPKSFNLLSTNKAIFYIISLFVFFVFLSFLFGAPLSADPANAVGQSMIKNAPVRALLSLTLTFLTVLVGVFLIRVFFPQFYRIWHNRIDSERSLEQLLQEAPAWAVLLSLLALFYMFMQLFASFYQALYA